MALWIKTRPDDQADATELAVATQLAKLPDEWLVIWGYYYAKNRNETLDHEGDFIVQSPEGRVLVLR